MAAREEIRPANEEMAPGQSLYLQAMGCLNEKTGKNSKVSGYLDRNEEIKQAAQALGLSDGGKLPSFSSLRFRLSQGRRRLIGKKEVRLRVEAKLRTETIKILILAVTSDGECQHKITQRGSIIIGPYGVEENDKTGTVRPKRKTTAEEIGACQILLAGIESQARQSDT